MRGGRGRGDDVRKLVWMAHLTLEFPVEALDRSVPPKGSDEIAMSSESHPSPDHTTHTYCVYDLAASTLPTIRRLSLRHTPILALRAPTFRQVIHR
jgi:hypothetical protein